MSTDPRTATTTYSFRYSINGKNKNRMDVPGGGRDATVSADRFCMALL